MAEWKLDGNQDIAARLREAASQGTLSHALLFTGSGDRMEAATYAAAAFECEAEKNRPCGVCAACRKVQKGIHPDVTVVQDAEHKNIAVDVVRAARSDVYIRPNEGRRKVYIFPDCSILTEQDQNVLLKIVEEGPPYAAFCFCAENPSSVLQTLRSRCVELKLRPAGRRAAAIGDQAQLLCLAVGKKKPCGVTEVLIRMERAKMTREELATMLSESYAAFAAALLTLCGQEIGPEERETADFLAKNLTKTQIMRTIELLQKYRQECQFNVSAGQVLGALAVELEGIL
ncbi:MAG: DNA polymerase III subunit delta' [Oscillibacter sp.]|jgi:DNA polymerase III delta prime subunit|nr:DNA polymerase III subunit delta' [Oscillibacter sp.]